MFNSLTEFYSKRKSRGKRLEEKTGRNREFKMEESTRERETVVKV